MRRSWSRSRRTRAISHASAATDRRATGYGLRATARGRLRSPPLRSGGGLGRGQFLEEDNDYDYGLKQAMGKPTGFIEYLRELPVDRTPQERVRDWKEFHHHMEEKRLRHQAARCMDCGVPFCHTGKLISGMASGCPVNNVIPEWNDLVHRGLWRE